jgi:hypothetical protein
MWIQSGREGVAHRLARAAEGEGGEDAGVDGLQWFGAAVSTGAASTGGRTGMLVESDALVEQRVGSGRRKGWSGTQVGRGRVGQGRERAAARRRW